MNNFFIIICYFYAEKEGLVKERLGLKIILIEVKIRIGKKIE